LEICRINNIEYATGIKNFKEVINTHGVLLSIVNHVELVDVFVNLPIEKRGQLQNDQLQSLELNEINYDQEYFYGKASGSE
jgi:hypothetical protein